MRNIRIAYIGGGSRGWARNIMADLALTEAISGTVALYDIDMEAARMNAEIGNTVSKMPGCVSKWEYVVEDSLEKALEGADYVVISILPGTFSDMRVDVHLPEKYGIYQSVGDTVGPGGVMRAVRAVPFFLQFARAVRDICPQAYVINYSNPLTVLTRTLYKGFPGIKAFGCCHEVKGTKRLLASIAGDALGGGNPDIDDIDANVLGINHFTWLDTAKYKGTDLFPTYRDFAVRHYEKGFCARGGWNDDYFKSANRVKFDLFLRYGLIAAAGDRHLAEFCPGWYLKSPETAAEWRFNLTPVEWRENDMREKIEKTHRILDGKESFRLEKSGEDTAAIIKALENGGEFITNINIPNPRADENYPKDAIVETNAVFTKKDIKPVIKGRLPDDIENLVLRHSYNQELLVQSCINDDREGIFKVFANDPLVHLGITVAKKLFDEMMGGYD